MNALAVRLPVLLAAAALLAGCRSAEVELVNAAAVASRNGAMDDVSRLLAQDTLQLLAGREEDYRVGPGDKLEISVFEWEVRDQAKTAVFRVSENGSIALPVLGEMHVAGLAVGGIKEALEAAFRDGGILLRPQVSVEIKEFQSKRIAVLGAVKMPGVHVVQRNYLTLLEAIGAANGVEERAGYIAYVLRPLESAPSPGEEAASPRRLIVIDLYELMERGDLTLNVVLEPGSVVNIPEAGTVAVNGYVNKPGAFPLRRPTTVLEAIALAGGLKEREASPGHAVIKRRTPAGEKVFPLDLVAISRGEEENFCLAAGDVIDVRQRARRRIVLETWDAFKSIFSLGFALN